MYPIKFFHDLANGWRVKSLFDFHIPYNQRDINNQSLLWIS